MKSISIKITVFFVLMLLGIQTNHELFYYMLFYINRNVLAETVCEKKTETCKACCYLNKQIQKEAEQETPLLPGKEKKTNELKIQEYFPSIFSNNAQTYNKYELTPPGQQFSQSLFASSIFHPPKV